MTPRIYANDINVIVLYWSDNSRNVFFISDESEMVSFIDWKISKEPELTFEHEIMSVIDYKIKHGRMVAELIPDDYIRSLNNKPQTT